MSHKLSWVGAACAVAFFVVLIGERHGLELVRSPSRRRWRHLFWRPEPKRSTSNFSLQKGGLDDY
jgi:hypothetical protein